MLTCSQEAGCSLASVLPLGTLRKNLLHTFQKRMHARGFSYLLNGPFVFIK